ncbi:hypothetical protein JAAARDRAFT_29182 [Jaapia argillacea MUCL 33604]|uniref:Uncharacterized protein n=1 Tax=Jaapia argillacea MUCL 33604 TaxID=933084 RepID=A0A067Q873_9AGAM|nr:hypothetical protein JAAARDRAFT_29182 [Jaapia argillacea MUCL 33604]
MHMEDPEKHSVRALSQKFGLSLKRVDAILRLKGLEAHWQKQELPLQTGFLAGMQKILGMVETPVLVGDRVDMDQADVVDELQGDEARDKYQRMFWETVSEGGEEPTLPGVLDRARADAVRFAETKEKAKSDNALLGITDKVAKGNDAVWEPTPQDWRARYEVLFYEPKVSSIDVLRAIAARPWSVTTPTNITIAKSGRGKYRPLIQFEDVGGKFLDVQDRVRRMKEGERRTKIKTKKKLAKEQALRELWA